MISYVLRCVRCLFACFLIARRVTLVRHGQSTWNAAGRIQGSSDESVLTAKGEAQAETTATLLDGSDFDKLFYSPLKVLGPGSRYR